MEEAAFCMNHMPYIHSLLTLWYSPQSSSEKMRETVDRVRRQTAHIHRTKTDHSRHRQQIIRTHCQTSLHTVRGQTKSLLETSQDDTNSYKDRPKSFATYEDRRHTTPTKTDVPPKLFVTISLFLHFSFAHSIPSTSKLVYGRPQG